MFCVWTTECWILTEESIQLIKFSSIEVNFDINPAEAISIIRLLPYDLICLVFTFPSLVFYRDHVNSRSEKSFNLYPMFCGCYFKSFRR